MKYTCLYQEHIKLGAKMVDFAGWCMPVQYSSIIEEHHNVRNNVGLFDVSHMGEIIIEGKDALTFLNKLVPQDLSSLDVSQAIYCQLTNFEGGIKDDWIVYKLKDEKYLIIANASMVDQDVNWISLNKGLLDVRIVNESHNYSMIAVQGPKACDLIEDLGFCDLPEFFSIKEYLLNDIKVLISRTGYTGEDGVEILLENKFASKIWNLLLNEGKKYDVKPIGLGARDTLRLEAAMPLYGNDLDETTSPVEAGLVWSIPKDKVCDYNGKAIIDNHLLNGVNRNLYAFIMLDKGIARHGYEVWYNNECIGVVTSGGVSPTRGDNIGLAYINCSKNVSIDSIVQIKIRDRFYNARIIKKPFIEKRNKK